jgi:hypothetical protein
MRENQLTYVQSARSAEREFLIFRFPEVYMMRKFTRRQLLSGAAAGAVVTVVEGCRVRSRSGSKPERLAEENLINASALSGERLSLERIRAMKVVFEFNQKYLNELREFDPDEEEPLTMFRI